MNCFSCFQSQKSSKSLSKREHESPPSPREVAETNSPETKKQKPGDEDANEEANQVGEANVAAKAFNFREIATATKNFRQECLLGEGGFGRVFKGTLASNGQVVAVKQLDRSGLQENKDFLAEVTKLSALHHPSLVELVGYCADGDQRLLVYDFIKGGSLQEHLHDVAPEKGTLDWFTRMKIAFGTAEGLEYLHDKANPPVIFGDLKPTNILLDEDYTSKLSDFGLVKFGPSGDSVPSRLMGTYGYSAPEYARGGELTMKSDVYSFGVILLELITGRKAIDTTKPNDEQNLVAWAQPIFRDPKRFPDMADPVLKKHFPEKDLNQAVAIAAMCLQEESAARPLMSDVVTALSFLSVAKDESFPSPPPPSTPPSAEVDGSSESSEEDSDSDDSNEGSKKWSKNSRSGSSRCGSISSSRSSSEESQHLNISLSRNSSRGSEEGSVSEDEKSSRDIDSPDRTESLSHRSSVSGDDC
ncbi:probable serine/threonine-protein kinase PBL25 [Manihot esculenta]|uniref:Uncharacterized protein n=1 Tax=Manihot esculenta TaxID=3983 RepID=A0ACB7H6L7_MANES|nr:probable serine/threonine-protein kinase PBL25 [Manihot esculenta]KAG8648349.1 hypothetical protein MANES_09G183200v8 [Manihot esculenta]